MSTRNHAFPRRQAVRRVALLLSFIAFPLTLNYFSPYLIVDSAFQGIVNGSLIVFASMFLGSLVFGRLWCGWACPAAGLQEPLLRVNDCRVGRKADLAKWAIWVPWIALIVFAAMRAGGYASIDPFYGTVGGISLAGDAERPAIFAFIIYFGVVLTFFGVTLAVGRRGGCHALCWMAPFMISGRAARNSLGAWSSLRLVADSSACTKCGTCTRECPMSVPVQELVAAESMEHAECVLCGSCVDGCPSKVIRYSFSGGK
ncbi:MAG: 4Fe-4S dicluster domain-containing protein [Actinomycetota bacterium]|nr:4Fe-4S dicluster domain-containing protein [Actinomycetota bacterium]